MMPKPQYTQKFRDAWLRDPLFSKWLTVIESTAGQTAKCKICNKMLNNKIGDIKRHGESKKHLSMNKIIFGKEQPKIPFKYVEDLYEQKIAEANLAMFIACHCSINTVDHLNNVSKVSFKSCNAGNNLKIHRTKCANIIKNVLYPHFKTELMEDMNNETYSILIDESTDISTQKYLGIVVIYFSKKQSCIVQTYLDMPRLEEFNAPAIVAAIKYVLNKHKLNLNLLMGIGSDNASVMVGINNGVFALLRREVPKLILIRCICHSLQLAVSAAATKCLPRNLEFIIRETYDWFSRSCARQHQYKTLFSAMNDGKAPLKIIQACQTRWLSIERAICRILDQWLELKTHFSIARNTERCFTAETLYNMYNDEHNYALLSFLRSVLSEVQRVNKLFESNDADPTKLHLELMQLIDVLVSKITLPRQNKIDIFKQKIEDFVDRKCYLGYKFESTLQKLKTENKIKESEENYLRDRAINFVVELINEIKNRLPENIDIMSKISYISVEHALSHNKPTIVPLLEYFGKSDNEIEEIRNLWYKIHLFKWKNISNTKSFWYEVMNFKDAGENKTFFPLAKFVLGILVLPYSNAEVERLFSQLNIIKSKVRNRIGGDMVNAILTIKFGLKSVNKCCYNYTLPKEVINKIQCKETYEHIDTEDFEEIFTVI